MRPVALTTNGIGGPSRLDAVILATNHAMPDHYRDTALAGGRSRARTRCCSAPATSCDLPPARIQRSDEAGSMALPAECCWLELRWLPFR